MGQPEFSPPGCLSLHIVDEAITGSYTVHSDRVLVDRILCWGVSGMLVPQVTDMLVIFLCRYAEPGSAGGRKV